MKNNNRYLWFCLFFLLMNLPASAQYDTPDVVYEELFEQVQLEGIFPDSKTFVDCIPQSPPQEILAKYRQQKQQPGFRLKAFVEENFRLPEPAGSDFKSNAALPVGQHIAHLWSVLLRKADAPAGNTYSSLIPLPHPYIVPGGRFNEIYYWDSYFTMLGLQVSGRRDIIRNMVQNFSYLVDQLGFIPNGNRTYFTTRSQPPFYALMVQLLAQDDKKVLAEFLPQLEKEYAFWMNGSDRLTAAAPAYRRVARMPGGELLNRYYDDKAAPRQESYREDVETAKRSGRKPQEIYRDLRAACESGWDFSSRWFRDPQKLETIHTTDIIPVDLNCLLYYLETTIADGHAVNGNTQKQTEYAQKAARRKAAIRKYCWNKKTAFYGDYDFVARKPTAIRTAAATYPLFFNIATEKQAEAVARGLEKHLLAPGGLMSTPNRTSQQWDTNGWAPLQWMAIKGLMNYNKNELASSIRRRWVDLNTRVYRKTGKLVEKYNVMANSEEAGGGEYPLQDGFGWTNGVLLRLMEMEK